MDYAGFEQAMLCDEGPGQAVELLRQGNPSAAEIGELAAAFARKTTKAWRLERLEAVADRLPADMPSRDQAAAGLRAAAQARRREVSEAISRQKADRPPYLSVQPKGRNRNGWLEFQPESGTHGASNSNDPGKDNSIVCRHLAMAAAYSAYSPKYENSPLAHRMWDITGAEGPSAGDWSMLPRVLEQRFVETRWAPDPSLESSETLGEFLRGQAASLPAGETRQFMLCTARHAMLLQVGHKQAPDGRSYWAVSLYDPNDHAQIRTSASSIGELATITLDQLSYGGATRSRQYVGTDPYLWIDPLPPGLHDMNQPLHPRWKPPVVPVEKFLRPGIAAERGPYLLGRLMDRQSISGVRSYIRHQATLPPAEQVLHPQLVTDDADPGWLLRGPSVDTWLQAIHDLRDRLAPQAILAALQHKVEGTSFLGHALAHGQQKTIALAMDLLAELGPQADSRQVVAALVGSDKAPAPLALAASGGKVDAVKLFLHKLRSIPSLDAASLGGFLREHAGYEAATPEARLAIRGGILDLANDGRLDHPQAILDVLSLQAGGTTVLASILADGTPHEIRTALNLLDKAAELGAPPGELVCVLASGTPPPIALAGRTPGAEKTVELFMNALAADESLSAMKIATTVRDCMGYGHATPEARQAIWQGIQDLDAAGRLGAGSPVEDPRPILILMALKSQGYTILGKALVDGKRGDVDAAMALLSKLGEGCNPAEVKAILAGAEPGTSALKLATALSRPTKGQSEAIQSFVGNLQFIRALKSAQLAEFMCEQVSWREASPRGKDALGKGLNALAESDRLSPAQRSVAGGASPGPSSPCSAANASTSPKARSDYTAYLPQPNGRASPSYKQMNTTQSPRRTKLDRTQGAQP